MEIECPIDYKHQLNVSIAYAGLMAIPFEEDMETNKEYTLGLLRHSK